jgi:coenzyme F420-reducing hydrogenase alpha subunit
VKGGEMNKLTQKEMDEILKKLRDVVKQAEENVRLARELKEKVKCLI